MKLEMSRSRSRRRVDRSDRVTHKERRSVVQVEAFKLVGEGGRCVGCGDGGEGRDGGGVESKYLRR